MQNRKVFIYCTSSACCICLLTLPLTLTREPANRESREGEHAGMNALFPVVVQGMQEIALQSVPKVVNERVGCQDRQRKSELMHNNELNYLDPCTIVRAHLGHALFSLGVRLPAAQRLSHAFFFRKLWPACRSAERRRDCDGAPTVQASVSSA